GSARAESRRAWEELELAALLVHLSHLPSWSDDRSGDPCWPSPHLTAKHCRPPGPPPRPPPRPSPAAPPPPPPPPQATHQHPPPTHPPSTSLPAPPQTPKLHQTDDPPSNPLHLRRLSTPTTRPPLPILHLARHHRQLPTTRPRPPIHAASASSAASASPPHAT